MYRFLKLCGVSDSAIIQIGNQGFARLGSVSHQGDVVSVGGIDGLVVAADCARAGGDFGRACTGSTRRRARRSNVSKRHSKAARSQAGDGQFLPGRDEYAWAQRYFARDVDRQAALAAARTAVAPDNGSG